MKVVYLDQHLLSKLVRTDSRPDNREQLVELKEVLESTAARKSVVYPVSSTHIEETSNATDLRRRTQIIDLLEHLSFGYAFQSPERIMLAQARNAATGVEERFNRIEAICRSQETLHARVGPLAATTVPTKDGLQRVAERWNRLQCPIRGNQVEREELQTYHRMQAGFIADLIEGRVCSDDAILKSLSSIPSELFSELFELFTALAKSDPAGDALHFLKEKMNSIPSARLVSKLWRHYALQLAPNLIPQTDWKVDHMARDINTAANFFPYCDAVFHDKELVGLCKRVTDPAHTRLSFFKAAEFTQFTLWLRQADATFEPPVTPQNVHEEAKKHPSGTILAVLTPLSPEPLIQRTKHHSIANIEVLPGGGFLTSADYLADGRVTICTAFVPLLKTLQQIAHIGASDVVLDFFVVTKRQPVNLLSERIFAGVLYDSILERIPDKL